MKKIAESVSIPLIVYFNPNAGVNFTPEMAARIFEKKRKNIFTFSRERVKIK